jgi:hypothetical protein
MIYHVIPRARAGCTSSSALQDNPNVEVIIDKRTGPTGAATAAGPGEGSGRSATAVGLEDVSPTDGPATDDPRLWTQHATPSASRDENANAQRQPTASAKNGRADRRHGQREAESCIVSAVRHRPGPRAP